jgi:hypothetical protein
LRTLNVNSLCFLAFHAVQLQLFYLGFKLQLTPSPALFPSTRPQKTGRLFFDFGGFGHRAVASSEIRKSGRLPAIIRRSRYGQFRADAEVSALRTGSSNAEEGSVHSADPKPSPNFG